MRIKKLSLLASIITIVVQTLTFANSGDESRKIFDDTTVGEIKILIDQSHLAFILNPANAESDSLFPATFIYSNAVISGDTLTHIGFRIRGNTSRQSAKKSFRIDINHFVPGRQFYDLEKLNLNGEHNDPSIIRSKLCWDLFNNVGVPASRANHVKFYINNKYQGLYINVEHIDDEFVQKRFGNQNGNLYKCLYPADLVYLGSDQTPYKQPHNGRRAYDLTTNKTADDYSDLVHFIDVLNNTPQPLLKPELEKIFNVDNFLKWLAVDVLVGSWDDYWFLKNNYYLYHNTATDQFEFIPYDYDNTYGIDWVGSDWGIRNIYSWGNPSEARPLVSRILSVPEYKNSYTQYLVNYMNNEFAFETQQPKIDQIKLMITPAAEADSFRTLDWNFSIEDFHQFYTSPVATQYGHVPYGLKPYIQTRIATARFQLSYVNLPPNISQVEQAPLYPEPNQAVNIMAEVADNDQVISVRLYYRTTASNFQSLVMYDDGNHNDGNANDGRYGASMPPQSDGSVIYYYVEAQDNQLASVKNPFAAPENVFYYVSRNASNSDVLVKFHFNKSLHAGDVGVGLLGSFNDWNKIYPLKDNGSDFWELSCVLPQGNYIYKFVTYKNLNGSAGVTEWIADPENPERDGAPYFNAVLNVMDPMIYYIKPLNQDTVLTHRPEISAAFASSRNTTIDPASIVFRIDGKSTDHAGDYYDLNTSEFHYIPSASLALGKHTVYFQVQNSQGNSIEQSSAFFVSSPLLFINEFMATNTIILDEYGEDDDWIEIYNGDHAAVNLKGMFLTDDLTRPQRWMLPDTTLQAGEFLLIWADGDTSQGALHANFKLSAGGEQIGLFASLAMGNAPIDTLSFGPQTINISYGRYPDASKNWMFMLPTPCASNKTETKVADHEITFPEKFELWQNYPNPFNPETQIKFALPELAQVSLIIYNISGQRIKTLLDKKLSAGYHTFYWDGTDGLGMKVSSGTYFYQLQTERFQATRKMVLLR
ncbi:MAG TPA: CotH kinase family protein, partial [bacterium]